MFVPRFDPESKRNVHFHGRWADGWFDGLPGGPPSCHGQGEVPDTGVRRPRSPIPARRVQWQTPVHFRLPPDATDVTLARPPLQSMRSWSG